MGFRDRGIERKTQEQIEQMRVAGLRTGSTLEMLRGAVRPGITTGVLDALAEEHIRAAGGTPSFLGFGDPPFPGTICVSVNDQVVHGSPGDRVLAEGDLVSIDCGAIIVDGSGQGWHGDAAITVAVGEVSAAARELMRVTEEALWRGLAAATLGGRITDISLAVESHVRGQQPGHPHLLDLLRGLALDAPVAEAHQAPVSSG